MLKVPADMQYNGRGPLVSARLVDLDLLWGRAEQLLGACTEDRENIKVVFQEGNDGGLMTRLNGLQLFLPASFLIKDPSVRLSASVNPLFPPPSFPHPPTLTFGLSSI